MSFLSINLKVKIWNKIQKHYPVWHLDATGSIINDIQNQSPPFLFSLIMRDPKTETILPIYDFISTSHNSLTVSKYLMTFKKKIEMVAPTGSLKIAPIIVVDFSWPFINSILEIFSSCTIEL